ncbi:MAG: WXG100 family type VII secretion target [Bacilli bacterium]|nr:WXG100 family type VII secretion target [Bacilli bacterium]
MTNIVVNTLELNKYGEKIQKQVESFDSITTKMDEILTTLNEGWNGKDKQSFINNAVEYLNNLKMIERALSEYGKVITECSNKYQDRINDFYS